MIGNFKYIAHFMAQKEDSPCKDPLLIEHILNEQFRFIKYLMRYSESTSIVVPYLGCFFVKNRNLRRFVRDSIKRERKFREKEDKKPLLDIEQTMRDINMRQLKAALVQMDTMRYVFAARKAMNNKKQLSKKLDTINNK